MFLAKNIFKIFWPYSVGKRCFIHAYCLLLEYQVKIEEGDIKDQRIHAVKEAAVTGEYLGGIFEVHFALHPGFKEIADRSHYTNPQSY